MHNKNQKDSGELQQPHNESDKERCVAKKNTVRTVISQENITYLESILYDYWKEIDHECFTDIIMTIFGVYIKYCPKDVSEYRKPDSLAKFVSKLIQLNEKLREVMNEERLWEWIDTPKGWSLPM
jgi:hypothetical protein